MQILKNIGQSLNEALSYILETAIAAYFIQRYDLTLDSRQLRNSLSKISSLLSPQLVAQPTLWHFHIIVS